MKKAIIITLIVLTVAAVGIFFFWGRAKDCLAVIPKGSLMVGRVEAKAIHPDLAQLGSAWVFEDKDGQLGLVLPLPREKYLTDWISKTDPQAQTDERRGVQFATLSNGFVVGWVGGKVLAMGPVVEAGRSQLMQKMVGYLKNDEEWTSPMMERLKSMGQPTAFVAQTDALPEALTAFLQVGAPKGHGQSDILVAATIESTSGNGGSERVVKIKTETFSPKKKIDEALKASLEKYGTIEGIYLGTIDDANPYTVAANFSGNGVVEMLRGNDALRVLIAGLNTAIDIDKMLSSVDGDLVLTMPRQKQFQLVARSPEASWLKDVGYWKSSAPEGVTLSDWQPLGYHLHGKEQSAYFGMTMKGELYMASSDSLARRATQPSAHPMNADLQQLVKGERMVAIINVKSLTDDKPELRPIFNLLPVKCDKLLIVK